MARLRDIKKDEMFGGSRGNKPSQEEGPQVNYKELEKEIEQLEKDMNELRSTYELFFMGVEKVEPTAQRDLVKATLRRWKELQIKNTGVKFKIQQLKARMISLENYWKRTLLQREEGTYKRDQERAKRRMAEQKLKEQKRAAMAAKAADRAAGAKDGQPSVSADGKLLSASDMRAAGLSGARPGAQPPPDMSRPSASSADDLTEPKLKKLYQTYISARKRCNEAVDLRYEDMAAALRKQVPKLMETSGAKAVEFKVVIRGGHAVLKAVPKH